MTSDTPCHFIYLFLLLLHLYFTYVCAHVCIRMWPEFDPWGLIVEKENPPPNKLSSGLCTHAMDHTYMCPHTTQTEMICKEKLLSNSLLCHPGILNDFSEPRLAPPQLGIFFFCDSVQIIKKVNH